MLLSEQSDREIEIQRLRVLITTPLLPSPTQHVKQSEIHPQSGRALEHKEASAIRGDFVKIEKNLISLGFFTPSSKRVKGVKVKTLRLTQISPKGDRLEATATIVPAAIYGLPITADQDKWFALQRLINEIKQEDGQVSNPIIFTSSELIKLLGQGDAGKNYQEVSDWLDLMSNTGIISEGAVYLAGRRSWARDRFRVFERAISMGKQLDDGSIADRNYIWLSDWQLENINYNYLLPIDYEAYLRLRNHIAKALVPLLQIWLYATKEKGSFEKRYDELCQILSLRQYQHLSKIKEKFGPSLDELKEAGYLAAWSVSKTSDRKAHKITFYHGPKFHLDRRRRTQDREIKGEVIRSPHTQPEQPIGNRLLADLQKRGITESQASRLLRTLADDQHVSDQLEWGDQLIAGAPAGKFHNPPGLYVHLIRENVIPPPSFESSRQRNLRIKAQEAAQNEEQEKARLQLEYEAHRKREVDNYIASNYEEYQQYAEAKKRDLLSKYRTLSTWDEETLARLVETSARAEIAKRLPSSTFEAFCRGRELQHSIPTATEQQSNNTDQFLAV
jgi:replication initiator protein A